MTNLSSIAIAGAWGYIGRKFVEASLDLGLDVHVFDPGPAPADLDLTRIHRAADESAFYALDADLFHLALHPEHRQTALSILLPRASSESLLILDEKPMASPEQPGECARLVETMNASGATVLFDFPELFDPITHRILDFLGAFRDVVIEDVHIQRSKDREDRANPRNLKKMVPIQYQESVHCVAFVLNLLGRIQGGLDAVFERGLSVSAAAQPYDPPNPRDYAYVVDGRCDYEMNLGGASIHGHTNFKRHAPFRKQRVIRGTADGRPFEIDLDFLEDAKYLRINGEDQHVDPAGSSYEAVINQLRTWRRDVPHGALMRDVYPNPAFAHLTYQISSVLWRASRTPQVIEVPGLDALLAYDAGFAAEVPHFPRYGTHSSP